MLWKEKIRKVKKIRRSSKIKDNFLKTMVKTFDMQLIRYINLFGRITGVSAKHCFLYNNMIVFIVDSFAIERSLGRDNSNLKKISNIVNKRVRVLAEPSSKKDIEKFISVLVSPIQYQNLEVKDDEVIITAGMESKAMLIGRGRVREQELKAILEQYFRIKNLKII